MHDFGALVAQVGALAALQKQASEEFLLNNFERSQNIKICVSCARDAKNGGTEVFVFFLFFKNSLLVDTKRSLLSFRTLLPKNLRFRTFKITEVFCHKVCKGYQKVDPPGFRVLSGYYYNR